MDEKRYLVTYIVEQNNDPERDRWIECEANLSLSDVLHVLADHEGENIHLLTIEPIREE